MTAQGSPVRRYEALPASIAIVVFDSRRSRRDRVTCERVERLIASALERDSLHLRQAARIRSHQGRLKQRVSVAAWQLYLLLEEAEVERWSYLVDRVAEEVLRRRTRKS